MNVCIDAAWKSLNKFEEELCGDKVEVHKTETSDIVILADGMGSGVKANILATLTSKILGTMFLEGASIEDCVETIAKTLPVCQERKTAYATFSILQIFHDGNAYLAEFDNPVCVFVRDGKIVDYPYTERIIEEKKIREYRFRVQKNDCFVLMSDGVIYAGAGEILNFGWTWENMAEYTLKCTRQTLSAARLASLLSDACNDLYEQKPGDDTTVAVVRVRERQVVNIFTGPPEKKEDDERLMYDFMHSPGRKIVCGGTTANIAARVLGKEIVTSVNYANPDVPPTASLEGIDLVTEGVLTLGKTLKLLKRYAEDDFDVDFFDELDADNGASRLAKIIIEECTDLCLFVGRAVNTAHKDSSLPFDLSMRMNLVEQLKETAEKLDRQVTVSYY
ncbi:MAG TPA: serine/threonine-protein phosphatase [Candidatus Blautia faecavium]|uniref:Serine/threonine-protein phosphatase n=1 Tax=Candidatus Blautia faecavium TaxID=2838487 RepID=A0A9D2RWH8_9FIRM|nr:serine/threonine-protein phosphatase [Candidatus Blautia faecavium]